MHEDDSPFVLGIRLTIHAVGELCTIARGESLKRRKVREVHRLERVPDACHRRGLGPGAPECNGGGDAADRNDRKREKCPSEVAHFASV